MSTENFDELVITQEMVDAVERGFAHQAARVARRKADQQRRATRRAKHADCVKYALWNQQMTSMQDMRKVRTAQKVPRKTKKRLRYVERLLTLPNPYARWHWEGGHLSELRGYLPVWRRALRLSRYEVSLRWLAGYDEGIAFSDRLQFLWVGEYDNDFYTDYVTTPLTYEPGTFEEECVGEVLSAPSTLAELGITNDVQFLRFLSTHTLPSHGR